MPARQIDPAEFVRRWMLGESPATIAEWFGVHIAYVAIYATKLRAKGVKLPRRRHPRALDIDGLNALISEDSNGRKR